MDEPMSQSVAYLRRSRVDTRRPGALSHEQQLAEIRATAAKHGDEPLVIEDWGRSGRGERTHLREGFARLRAMIAAGEVSAVYAYDLSRLGRSLETVYALARECQARTIPIRCASGYSPDVTTADGRLVLGILLSIGEYFAESTKERMTTVTLMRRQRGDHMGPAPYGSRVRGGKLEAEPGEDVAAVLRAYRTAGTLQGTCRALNAAGVPTRGGRPWQPSTLAQVLEAHEARRTRPQVGRPQSRTFVLSGLLRCPCGATLTGRYIHGGPGVGYECKRARVVPGHGPASVAESVILPWIRAEAAHLAIPDEDPGDEPEPAPDAEALEGRRRRVIDLYKSGLIDKAERDADLAGIAADLAALARPPAVVSFDDGIPWEASAPVLNAVLRALWERVDFGPDRPDLRPVSAVWTVPEWRS